MWLRDFIGINSKSNIKLLKANIHFFYKECHSCSLTDFFTVI